MRNRFYSWLGPLTLGAAAMYLLDPRWGRRRRALIRDKAVWITRKTRDGVAALGSDLRNRVTGLAAETRHLFERDMADDGVLEERVHAALGRVSSHPSAITVFSWDGRVTLSGPVLTAERGAVVRAARRAGARSVDDQLQPRDQPGNIVALQGGATRPERTWLRGSWSPTTQAVAAVAGAGLVAYGARRGKRGM